jgi:hypothetical protein
MVAVMVMLWLFSFVIEFVFELSWDAVPGVLDTVGDLLNSFDGEDDIVGVLESVRDPLISVVGERESEGEEDMSFVGVRADLVTDCCHEEDGVLPEWLTVNCALDIEIRRVNDFVADAREFDSDT